jgi:uncharacterized protein
MLLAGLDARSATGTSLAAIGLTALFGVASFGALGEVAWAQAALVGLPAMAGTSAGTWLQQHVSSRFLALGFAAGALSGLFGVGGGILFVPTLALVLELTQLSAQATSLAAMIPVVAVGAWRQHRFGNVRWGVALVVGLASAVGVVGDVALRRLSAGPLFVVAGQLAWSARH